MTPTLLSCLSHREQPIPHTLHLFLWQREKALQEPLSCVWAGKKERGTKRGLVSKRFLGEHRGTPVGVRLRGRLVVRVLGRGEPSRCCPHSFPQPVGAATRSQGKCFDHSESEGLSYRQQSQHSQAICEGSLGGWEVEPTRQCCPLSGGKHVGENFAFGERHIPQPAWH